MENIGFYALALVAIIVGFFIIKKVTTCLIKTIVTLAIIAGLAAVYFMYFRQ